jgi:hypothetical protein
MVRSQFVLGFASCLLLMGCAGAGFPFKYYGLSAASYEGKMLGPKPEDDLALTGCAPTAQDASPCVVLFTKEFLSIKREYLDMQNRLIECEKPRKGD